MKKIIMFSGIDKEKGFTLDQTKELTRIIETGKSITENIENVEDASSNMGKTVEEQEKIAEQKNY